MMMMAAAPSSVARWSQPVNPQTKRELWESRNKWVAYVNAGSERYGQKFTGLQSQRELRRGMDGAAV